MTQIYLDMLQDVRDNGTRKKNRTGVDTIGVFSRQVKYDLSSGRIPLLTTKKINLNNIIHETLWYLKGTSSVKYLWDNGISIWDSWVKPESIVYGEDGTTKVDGDLGPVYGVMWRNWPAYRTLFNGDEKSIASAMAEGYQRVTLLSESLASVWHKSVDQVADAIRLLKFDPDSRRIIITGWNPAETPNMALPPCHMTFQFLTEINPETGRRKLNCHLLMRL